MKRNDIPKSPHTRKGVSVGKVTKLAARVFGPAREQCGDDEIEAAQVAIEGGRVNRHRKRTILLAGPQSEVAARTDVKNSAGGFVPGHPTTEQGATFLVMKGTTPATAVGESASFTVSEQDTAIAASATDSQPRTPTSAGVVSGFTMVAPTSVQSAGVGWPQYINRPLPSLFSPSVYIASFIFTSSYAAQRGLRQTLSIISLHLPAAPEICHSS